MIQELPNIVGVPPQLLQALNDRIRTISTQVDTAQNNITTLQNAANNPPAGVTSVNGQTGAVTLKAPTTKVVLTVTLGTAIQNTHDLPMWVTACWATTSHPAQLIAYSDANSTPTTQVASVENLGTGGGVWSMTFVVFPGQYFLISAASGSWSASSNIGWY